MTLRTAVNTLLKSDENQKRACNNWLSNLKHKSDWQLNEVSISDNGTILCTLKCPTPEVIKVLEWIKSSWFEELASEYHIFKISTDDNHVKIYYYNDFDK